MLTRFKIRTNLRIYTCIVKYSKDRRTFELDVFDGEPYFKDGTLKYMDEAEWIGGYEDEEFTHTTKPVELAKKIVDQWERPQKLENYLRLKNHFIHMKDKEEEAPAKVTPPPVEPVITDYEEQIQDQRIKYLMENPLALDQLQPLERKQLLKENPELRLAYYELKALQKSGGAK